MGHGKETPRQKMIGMMYLVLTAMLALNVSKEVLDAFVNVDEGLVQTTESFAAKNEGLYSRFQIAYQQNPEKVGDWKNKAEEVKKRSDKLFDFMNECKVEIVSVKEPEAVVDGKVDLKLVEIKDNTDTPAEIMITNKKGIELKERIEEYREYVIDLIDNSNGEYDLLISSIEGNLDTHDHPAEKAGEPPEPWESHNFEHLPLASVITILSGMQADLRNVESEMINYLLNQVDAKDFKVNVLEPVVMPNSNYVFKGQEYRAEVFLAAYDSTNTPSVILDNGNELPVEGGKGVFTSTSNTTGERSWGGTITLDNDGQMIEREFSASYTVAQASAVVSPTKMLVFYRGVDNPVSVSASGVGEENLDPRISSGTIKKVRDGSYLVRPGPRETESTISVYANVEGSQRFMGEMDFRVLNLPTPTATVAGLPGGQGILSLGQLTRLKTVEAEAEDFLFEVDFTVTEFKVNVIGTGGISRIETSESNKFTAAQKEIFRGMRTGQRVYIEDIKAIGPDGVKRDLNNITIKIR